MDSGIKDKCMGMGHFIGKMGPVTKANINMAANMERELFIMQTETIILDNGLMETNMVKVGCTARLAKL